MNALLTGFSFLALAAAPAAAQITYDVRFPNAEHHEAEITAVFSDLRPGPLELRMSRSSPGRYALHEFAKNVYRVRAEDGQGRALHVARPNPYQWDVTGHSGTVRVTYTLFGDRGDGTYAQIDRSHAHLNMPATFMWARGLDERAIRVTFHPPTGSSWRVATQLSPSDDPFVFSAPDLQYFMDSPTELSDFSLRAWDVTGRGKTYTMRLAVHHDGTEADVDGYAAMVRRVVDQEIAVFGAPADYDYGSYTFIADYLPWASGDGMEHRNSTIIASSSSLAANALRLLGTVSHEFFHSWNVERIRPATLEPFDFERANMSGELWFAEGFTNYYGPLFLRRAGLITVREYAQRLTGPLDVVINAPGREYFSPVEMSMQAPFVDAATAIDRDNRTNTFISYYTWGSVIGLNLDLTLRSRLGKSLDDFMRLVWRRFGDPETPYSVDDLERTLAEFADAPFARDFFTRYVRGREVPDYAPLLAHAGLLLRHRRPGEASLGTARLEYDGRGAVVVSGTRVGSPLYEAGIDRGDRILTLDGRPIRSAADWAAAREAKRPGDAVSVSFLSRGVTRQATIRLIEDPQVEVVTYEDAGRPVSDAMRRFRTEWLGDDR